MKHPKHFLTLVYYIILIVTILVTMISYKYIYLENNTIEGTNATIIHSIIIMYVIISIPTSLYLFNKKIKNLHNLPDDGTREHYYKLYGSIRLILNAIGLYMSIIGFYLLIERTLLWLAGIVVIILIICKPNGKRIDADLSFSESDSKEQEIDNNNTNS